MRISLRRPCQGKPVFYSTTPSFICLRRISGEQQRQHPPNQQTVAVVGIRIGRELGYGPSPKTVGMNGLTVKAPQGMQVVAEEPEPARVGDDEKHRQGPGPPPAAA